MRLPPPRSRAPLAAMVLAATVGGAATGQPRLGEAGHAAREIPRVKGLHPMRSFLELADWFEGRGRPARAFEIVAFALLHRPRDPALLLRAALLNRALGDDASARIYARRVLDLRPRDLVARRLLADLAPPPPEAGPGPAVDVPAEPELAPEEPAPGEPSLADRLAALSLMKVLRSAILAYAARHPKTPLEELDLGKLREDGLLPVDFDHPLLDRAAFDGEVRVEGIGSLSGVEEAVGGYMKGLKDADDWIRKGHPHEALRDLEGLQERYGRTPRIRQLELVALRAVDPERARLRAREEPATAPGAALERALALWRTGARADAAQALEELLRTWPSSSHAPIARRLLRLLEDGHSLEGLARFYDARRRALEAAAVSATGTTTATTEAADPSEEAPPEE